MSAAWKRWREKNLEKDRAAKRAYARSPAGRASATRARRKYLGQPDPLYPPTAVCEICHGPFGTRGPMLDHDHVTGQFRGWLCVRCNSSLGQFGDNAAGIRNVLDYLGREVRVK